MFRFRFEWKVLRDVSWWHWVATIPLLAAHLAGYSGASETAMLLCAAATGYYLWRLKRFQPYPVQVRAAYLGWLGCGLIPGLSWLYWVPLVGTTAMVAVGYCPLLRMLSLTPWNRSQPLRWALVWETFVHEPCAGGLLQWTAVSARPRTLSCSPQVNDTAGACSLVGTPASAAPQSELICAQVN